MVHLTNSQLGVMKTFALTMKGKIYNHRKPIKYQRFQASIDPDQIVAHYSRDDIDQINRHEGVRTYKDATMSLGRTNYLLPELSAQDLETNEIFQRELDRQRAIVARVNKIQVIVDSVPGKGTELTMNQNISTPFDCARHIHNLLTTRTVVAELQPLDHDLIDESEVKKLDVATNVDSIRETNENSIENDSVSLAVSKPIHRSIYWDMHRPLEESCKIRFRHFSEDDVGEINKIYWRSCSFVLGMAARLAFKNGVKVLLHSWPKPNVKSGSFVYDLALSLSDIWQPTEQELRSFTKIMWNIENANLPFDRLQVDRQVASKLFAYNSFKLAQIESILSNESSQGKITVYRCGGLLDISVGPMIANTNQIGRITLASVHPFESKTDEYKGIFYRFQGVSLPQQLPMSSYLYQHVLIDQAKKLNKVSL